MRASPPLQVTLTTFGLWRVGVLTLSLAAALTPLAWLWAQPQWPPVLAIFGVGALVLTAFAFGLQLQRVPARSLRWDGQRWHLGSPRSAGNEPAQGELSVAIDLGAWMLLRFVVDGRPRRPAVIWLPVQRRGLEPQWHALRCAVYSPRPGTDQDVPARG